MIMGQTMKYDKTHDSLVDLKRFKDTVYAIEAIDAGIPAEVYAALKNELKASDKSLSKPLWISISTIRRRKHAGRFKSDESERIVRIVRLFELAKDVLGDPKDAALWMQEKSIPLGMETPLEHAKTEPGGLEVEALLNRIRYTIYS